MASIPITIQITNTSAIRDAIAREMARILDDVIQKSVDEIQQEVGQQAAVAIRVSPEYASLLSGRLKFEFGLPNAQPVLEQIIDTIATSVVVAPQKVQAVADKLTGGMTVSLLQADFSDILDIPGATFVSEGGSRIEWLDWLLNSGNQELVFGYEFEAGPYGRTGGGHMVVDFGGGWSVPPEFAGDRSDNWLTRALSGFEVVIESIIESTLKRAFQ